MNRYVATSERKHLLRLGAIMAAADEAVAEYSKLKKTDKEFLKYIRTMGTFAQKALSVRMKYLDPDAVVKLAQETKNHVIVMKTRSEATVEAKQVEAQNEIYPVKADDLLDLIEITIERTCQLCNGAKADNCRLKKILIQYNIAPFDPDPRDGCCPYQYQ